MNKENWRIVSKNTDVFQILMSLKTNRKKRSEAGELFVEGIESIKQALSSPRVTLKRIIFVDYERLSDWAKALIGRDIFGEVIELEKSLYAELSDKDEPAEIMVTLSLAKPALEGIVLPENPLIVIFDRPSDHGNLGSLIRSANAFGVDLFVTHGHCVDAFDPKVIRSSLGAVFHTPVVHEESAAALEAWLLKLKTEIGLTVIGTDSTGDSSLKNLHCAKGAALILGNEAKGMSVRLKELSDKMVRIPIKGAVNSLNVACAGSILMWHLSSD